MLIFYVLSYIYNQKHFMEFKTYNKLNEKINDKLHGELTHTDNNMVVWSFYSDMTLRSLDDESCVDEDDVEIFSIEEKLMDSYQHDIILIRNTLLEDYDNKIDIYYSNPVVRGECISFEFYEK